SLPFPPLTDVVQLFPGTDINSGSIVVLAGVSVEAAKVILVEGPEVDEGPAVVLGRDDVPLDLLDDGLLALVLELEVFVKGSLEASQSRVCPEGHLSKDPRD